MKIKIYKLKKLEDKINVFRKCDKKSGSVRSIIVYGN